MTLALNAHLPSTKYRPDIDGLRALAVVSVVGFHAFPEWRPLAGGFIGVDIFFVISGFLISTIIFEGLDKGTFRFTDFYARRIRRIFPALLLVLVACYAFGWFALLADEYSHLAKHIAAGAAFVSNIVLWKESGYFDAAAETKPLLHLWSLGIEEQFYIVWPLLLLAVAKSRLRVLALVLAAAVVSFVLNLKGVGKDAVATFYAPQTRFWELLCGSLLAWLLLYRPEPLAVFADGARRKLSVLTRWRATAPRRDILPDLLSVAGAALLAIGFSRITKDTAFPGAWAGLPVLGTVLIILAGPEAWINRQVLSNRLAVWIGLLSFPLYLWHWPLLSFARIVESGPPATGLRIAAVVAALALAWLTYTVVERPLRWGGWGNAKAFVLAFLMAGCGVVGYATFKDGGYPARLQEREDFVGHFAYSFPDWKYFRAMDMTKAWRAECAFFDRRKYFEQGTIEGGARNSRPVDRLDPSCYERDLRFEKAVLVWGDSHAQHLSPGITRHMPGNWQVLQVATSACLPDTEIPAPSTENQCAQSNWFAMQTIRSARPDVVVVAQAGRHSVPRMQAMAAKLRDLGVGRVLFIGPVPHWTTHLPRIMGRQLWLTKPRRTFVGVNRDIIRRDEKLARTFPKSPVAEYVSVIDVLCNTDGCLTYTGEDMKESLTAWDRAHLTVSGSEFLARNLLVQRIVGEGGD